MNQTVLITGASRGIGEACARHFAAQGYNLYITCKNSKEKLFALADELSASCSISCTTFVGDIGDPTFVASMFQTIEDSGKSVDVLINNAGISYIGLLSDMDIADWNRLIATNLTSVFTCSKAVISHMVHEKSGKIINISSVWGEVGASCEVAYSACKGGINAFTKGLAKELAPSNIQVNAISCGCIDTSMNSCFSEDERKALEDEIPAGRFGRPEEVAELALSIVTGPSYLTGQVITLDGGWI